MIKQNKKTKKTKSNQTKSNQTKSNQTKSNQTKSNKTKSNQTKSNQKKLNKINKIKKTNISIGCHASIANGILEGIKYVESIGGNALQIFMGSNRSASMKTKHKFNSQLEIDEIRNYILKNNIILIIHTIYLLNFCSYPPISGHNRYMHDNIQYDLKYGQMLGAKCVVLHLGSKVGLQLETAIENLIGNINYIIKHMPKGIMLSLETSAGGGTQIGWNLEELAIIWKGIKHNSYVGICIDTAHIFVSGYDISTVEGISDYIKKFDSLIGIKNITNFHINDSKYSLGSKHDEHRGIGQGLIYNTDKGKKALKYIKNLCIKNKIPMILETHSAGSAISEGSHKGQHGYEYEIGLIKKL